MCGGREGGGRGKTEEGNDGGGEGRSGVDEDLGASHRQRIDFTRPSVATPSSRPTPEGPSSPALVTDTPMGTKK